MVSSLVSFFPAHYADNEFHFNFFSEDFVDYFGLYVFKKTTECPPGSSHEEEWDKLPAEERAKYDAALTAQLRECFSPHPSAPKEVLQVTRRSLRDITNTSTASGNCF